MNVKFEIFFDIVKKDDGEIYFKGKPEKIRYEYDIDDAKFVTEILFGEQDASEYIVFSFESEILSVKDISMAIWHTQYSILKIGLSFSHVPVFFLPNYSSDVVLPSLNHPLKYTKNSAEKLFLSLSKTKGQRE